MGSRSRIRWIGLLFGVAALGIGGCGTLSGGVKSASALLADSSAASLRQEPVATAVAAETRVESPPVALPSAESVASQPAPPPFVPVTFEAIPPGRATFAMIASSGSSVPAGALLAQAPSDQRDIGAPARP